jgi:hypothetical protein
MEIEDDETKCKSIGNIFKIHYYLKGISKFLKLTC